MSVQNYNTIIKTYQKALQEHPHGIKSYRWSYKKEQELRFAELLKVAGSRRNLVQRSILDVGCGRGDLYKYFINQRLQAQYTGIDLMPEFISEAKKHYPKAKFIEKDFLKWQTNESYDYVIASGLLSVNLSGNNKEYLQASVKKMLNLAKQGIAFNFLTIFRTDKFKRWYYYDPGEIVDWCASLKPVKRLLFSMGYDPEDKFGDATILLLKKTNNN